jgi:hypothetical protein
MARINAAVFCGERPPFDLSLAALTLGMLGSTANAFEFDSGNPDLRVRWDNSLKYSAASRVKGHPDKLTQGQPSTNLDDGVRNFGKGLISSCLDLLPEFDITYQNIGSRVSGAAGYDDAYNKETDNNAPDRVNNLSGDHFTNDTRDLHGRNAEVLDAFIFGKREIADSAISGRLGQYATRGED